MSVNPGFGGQSFIENTYTKIEKLKALIKRKNATTLIEIDGGITDANARQLVEADVNVLVAGNLVYADFIKYCSIGQAIWAATDIAKYNNYVVYNTANGQASEVTP